MTKQDIIRKGIANRCFENCDGATQEQCDELKKQYDGVDACRYCGADQVLKYLHSQGGVIKVDRELPIGIIEKDLIDLELQKTSRQWVLLNLDYQIKTAGLVAVEPLIEVNDDKS